MKRTHASARPKPARGPRRCLANLRHRPHVHGAGPGELWGPRGSGRSRGPRQRPRAPLATAGPDIAPRSPGPASRMTAQNGASGPAGPRPGQRVLNRPQERGRRETARPSGGSGGGRGARDARTRGRSGRVPSPRPSVPGVLPPRSRSRSLSAPDPAVRRSLTGRAAAAPSPRAATARPGRVTSRERWGGRARWRHLRGRALR